MSPPVTWPPESGQLEPRHPDTWPADEPGASVDDEYGPRQGGRHRRGHPDRVREVDPYGSRRGPVFRRQGMPLWKEVPLLLVIAFVLATVIKTFIVQAFYIPSGSMETTLLVKDRVVVNKFVYDFRDPRRGEIVVFRGTDSWSPEGPVNSGGGVFGTVGRAIGGLVGAAPPDEKDFIKRVIGVGGDTVSCCDAKGRYQVNGVGMDEKYIYDDTPLAERPFGPITVPRGRLFMMGDHRGDSADSRYHLDDQWRGTIPVAAVIGRASVTVWPFDRFSVLHVPTYPKVPVALPAAGPGVVEPPELPPADRTRHHVTGIDPVR